MAKYDVTYSCGHDGEVTLYGPNEERERKLEWMAREGLCPDCYKAKLAAEREARAKEHEAQNAAAAAEAQELGLVPLTGSDKQVAWATTLRSQLIAWARPQKPQQLFWDALQELADGAWWIDNRGSGPYDLMAAIARRLEAAQA